jgi:hypothetical protein
MLSWYHKFHSFAPSVCLFSFYSLASDNCMIVYIHLSRKWIQDLFCLYWDQLSVWVLLHSAKLNLKLHFFMWHRPSVASLCGWSRTSAGRLIAWHVVGCLILSTVLFVTKKRRQLAISLSIVCLQENFGSICSDRSVFKSCPLCLQSYPSMLGGRKLAAALLMGCWGKELIHLLFSELGLFGTIAMGVFLMEQPQI